MAINIGRRQFISALGGTAIPSLLAARAEQSDRVWRVAVIGAGSPLPALALPMSVMALTATVCFVAAK
jgi:hypothetical protein